MRRMILPACSLLLVAGSMLAEELPPVPVQPNGGDVSKEQKNAEDQYRAIRKKAEQDPEVIKLKAAQEEATKAYKAKLEAVMLTDPVYVQLKAKRDEQRAKNGKPKDGGPNPNQPPQ